MKTAFLTPKALTTPRGALSALAAAGLGYVAVRLLLDDDVGAGGTLLDYLSIGLAQGAIYAFIALGYTMVYGVIRLINFAHGEFFMAGAFAGYFVLRDAGIDRVDLPQPWPIVLSYAAALAVAALAAGLLALIAEALCYRPIRKADRVAALMTAVGLSLLLQNSAQQWPAIGPTQRPWPAPRLWASLDEIPSPADATYYELRSYPTSSGGTIEREKFVVLKGKTLAEADRARLSAQSGKVVFRKGELSALVVNRSIVAMLIVATAGLWFLVQRTKTGKAMRAVSEDLAAARLMGINANRVIAATFFLGAFLAGLGGVAFAAKYGQADALMGFKPGLKAFIAAVLGGIGSIPGAVVGGLLLGISENLFGRYVSTQWQEALGFVLLVAILLLRPTGLLGKARREKV